MPAAPAVARRSGQQILQVGLQGRTGRSVPSGVPAMPASRPHVRLCSWSSGIDAGAGGVQPDLSFLQLAKKPFRPPGVRRLPGAKTSRTLEKVVHLILQVGRQHLPDLVDGPEALGDGVAADVAGQAVFGRELIAGVHNGGELAPAQRLAVIVLPARRRPRAAVRLQRDWERSVSGLAQHPASPCRCAATARRRSERHRPRSRCAGGSCPA